MGRRHCSAINCRNNSKANPTMSFFQCPKNEERSRKWIQNSRRDDLRTKGTAYWHRNIMFCPDHFEDNMFMNVAEKKRLVWNAVPTLFKVPNPPPKETSSRRIIPRIKEKSPRKVKSEQRKIEETKMYITSQKKKPGRKPFYSNSIDVKRIRKALEAKKQALRYLQKKNEREKLKNAVKEKSELIKMAKNHLSSDQSALLTQQLSRKNGTKSVQFKALAMSLAYKSPSCYRMLQKKLGFPTRRTIDRWAAKVKIVEGFDLTQFKMLQKRINLLSPENRLCTLLVDEMSIKQHVQYDKGRDKILGLKNSNGQVIYQSNALVFMLSGLRARWRHAVAFFTSGTAVSGQRLKDIIIECIEKLQKQTNVNLIGLTSDQGPNFSSTLTLLGISHMKPYLEVNGQKIFVFCDQPHIFKSIRNCLLVNQIKSSLGTASWTDIETVFELDKKQAIRLCPKLTENHISPPKYGGKMKVSLATQVLSHSVSTAIRTNVSLGNFGEQSKSALETAAFVENCNNLFDVMNSSTKVSTTVYKSAITKTSIHREEIQKMIEWVNTWKILDRDGKNVTSRFRFINGIKLSLTSILGLAHELLNSGKLEFLMTRRLCQDPLEQFFSIIRQKGGFSKNPSCQNFQQAYKQANIN